MIEATGDNQFSLAIGTQEDVQPETLEALGYVECRDNTPPFEYRITDLGAKALVYHDETNG